MQVALITVAIILGLSHGLASPESVTARRLEQDGALRQDSIEMASEYRSGRILASDESSSPDDAESSIASEATPAGESLEGDSSQLSGTPVIQEIVANVTGSSILIDLGSRMQVEVRKLEDDSVSLKFQGVNLILDLHHSNEDVDLAVSSQSQRNFSFVADDNGTATASLSFGSGDGTLFSASEGSDLYPGDGNIDIEFSKFNASLNMTYVPELLQADKVGHADDQNAVFDFLLHGADWPENFPECALGYQSPINLFPPMTKYGQSYEILSSEDDSLRAEYSNQANAEIYFHPAFKTLEVLLSVELGYVGFKSNLAETAFGAPARWDAKEIVLRYGAEHLIDGKRHDLELQIIHVPASVSDADNKRRLLSSTPSSVQQAASDDDFQFSTISIFFSVNEPTADLDANQTLAVDEFFEEMNLRDDFYTSEFLSFGKLMSMVDMSNRWIYKGSHTMPPCTRSVLWNVMDTVLPVKQKVLDDYSAKLMRAGFNTTELGGNYREVQTMINWEVFYVKSAGIRLSQLSSAIILFVGLLSLS